jgi:uncharacterized protein YecT (DUF1311 family)
MTLYRDGRPGIWGAAALALLVAGPAAAQQVDCANPMVQVEMNYCAEQAWMRADAELNDAWSMARDYAKGLDGDLPAAERGIFQALLDGQRAWIVYRDKTCEAEGGPMRGGAAEPRRIFGCRERRTGGRGGGVYQVAAGVCGGARPCRHGKA